MMLVPKQPPMPHHHRRHPSAPPAVIVQATRTPGLLSLSKPPQPQQFNRPSPQRPLPSQQRHQPKPPPKVARALAPPAEIAEKEPRKDGKKSAQAALLPAAHIVAPRGRPAKHAGKDKPIVTRSASHSSLHGKHNRQPSPPIAPASESSQAEASPPVNANQFDPFLDNSMSANNATNNNPTLTSRPSGKLARRRQQQQQQQPTPPSTPSPAHTKAIPVPKSTRARTTTHNNHHQQLSRSVPLPTYSRPNPKRNSASAVPTPAMDPFPICDDLTDAGDLSDTDDPPRTPTRKLARAAAVDAPRTAPLSSRTPGAFPFTLAHSPSPAAGRRTVPRQHRRTPSEGMFAMSSDEEPSFSSTSTGSLSGGLNPSVQALFGLVTPRSSSMPSSPSSGFSFGTPVPSRAQVQHYAHLTPAEREAELERDAEREVKGYFASSAFQNSPSPEELPDPLFV